MNEQPEQQLPDIEEAKGDMKVKKEMWLEHLEENVERYRDDPEPADHSLKLFIYHLHVKE